MQPKVINEIICQYKTEKDNQYINIIKYMKNVDFTLIIDNVKYNKEFSHYFEKAGIHNVTFEFKNNLDSLEGFFEDNKYLISADFSNLKTENIKSMESLFSGCINMNNFTFDKEMPNLENTSYMFYNCKSLNKTLILNITNSQVKYMDYMFYLSVSLTYLDLSKFNLENLINTSYMFYGCTNLREIKFNENSKTINLEDMNHMFEFCNLLKYISIKIFNQNKLKN